jgi:hypothetical protein
MTLHHFPFRDLHEDWRQRRLATRAGIKTDYEVSEVLGPTVWFAQAEAQFSLASAMRTIFYYVISLQQQQQDSYTSLRTETLNGSPFGDINGLISF